ncbi:MAG: hypothetical protein QW057_03545 [Candidatus Bathyarchaeia archaeon]
MKAVLFDLQGRVVAEASRPYPVAQPRMNWAEPGRGAKVECLQRGQPTAHRHSPSLSRGGNPPPAFKRISSPTVPLQLPP